MHHVQRFERELCDLERRVNALGIGAADESAKIDAGGGALGRTIHLPGPGGRTLELLVLEKLGESNNAVYRSVDQDRQVYAVKIFRFAGMDDDERDMIIDSAKAELGVMQMLEKRLGQNDFCRRYALCATTGVLLKNSYIIASPSPGTIGFRVYCEEMASSKPRGMAYRLQVARFASDLMSGLAILHEADMVHRDLKPENVVVQYAASSPIEGLDIKMDTLRIIDFDLLEAEKVYGAPFVEGTSELTRMFDRDEMYQDPMTLMAPDEDMQVTVRKFPRKEWLAYMKHFDVYLAATVASYPLRTRLLLEGEAKLSSEQRFKARRRPLMESAPDGAIADNRWSALMRVTKNASGLAEQLKVLLETTTLLKNGQLDELEDVMAANSVDDGLLALFGRLGELVNGADLVESLVQTLKEQAELYDALENSHMPLEEDYLMASKSDPLVKEYAETYDPEASFPWLLELIYRMSTPNLESRISASQAAVRLKQALRFEFVNWKQRPSVFDSRLSRKRSAGASSRPGGSKRARK